MTEEERKKKENIINKKPHMNIDYSDVYGDIVTEEDAAAVAVEPNKNTKIESNQCKDKIMKNLKERSKNKDMKISSHTKLRKTEIKTIKKYSMKKKR